VKKRKGIVIGVFMLFGMFSFFQGTVVYERYCDDPQMPTECHGCTDGCSGDRVVTEACQIRCSTVADKGWMTVTINCEMP